MKRYRTFKRKHKSNCDCLRCFKRNEGRYGDGTGISKVNDYFQYIKSTMWRTRKHKYYQTHSRKCEACGRTDSIELHHIVYPDSFGREKDTDLVCLCDICHSDFHRGRITRKDMRAETKQFIETRQLQIKHAVRIFPY
jgi:hypothetical protein